MIIKNHVICGLIAFCVSCGTMPIIVKISERLGAVSEVGGRHIGNLPIGRLGGFGVLLGVFASIVSKILGDAAFRCAIYENRMQMTGLLIGVLLVGAIGFWDDLRRLSAGVKLGIQVVAALTAYCFDLRIVGIDLPLLKPFQLDYLSLPITMLWIIGIVNAINLIDGLDGLAGGVLLFSSIVHFVAALGANSIISASMMVSIGGAVLGFLLYNWHPAKIYLGDGGAYTLGFILAVSGLLAPMQKAATGVALLIPILALGLPIVDTLMTMLRRFIGRRGIFSPDRGHLHHILLDAGISHRRVVVGLYAICCVLCSLALVMVLRRNRDIGYCFVAASVVGCVFWSVSVKGQLGQAMAKIIKSGSDSAPMKRWKQSQ